MCVKRREVAVGNTEKKVRACPTAGVRSIGLVWGLEVGLRFLPAVSHRRGGELGPIKPPGLRKERHKMQLHENYSQILLYSSTDMVNSITVLQQALHCMCNGWPNMQLISLVFSSLEL